MRCAARASWDCRLLRCGGWARKTAPSGTSGTSPAIPIRCDALGIAAAGPRHRHRGRRRDHPHHRTAARTASAPSTVDTDEPDPRKKLIIDEHMDVYPHTYTVQQYGYHPNEVALSFDDGPDPKWTPKILDILKHKGAQATFMLIGDEAQQNIGLMQRIVREGHEIGNHTYTHPDISEISHAPTRPGSGADRAPLRQQAGRAAALFPAAVRHRRRARHRRPGRAGRTASSSDGLTVVGQQDRHRRLGRTQSTRRRRRSRNRCSTS